MTGPKRTVAVLNQKGGVGKTTTAVHLAHALAFHGGARVLLVDLDPQANATLWIADNHALVPRDVAQALRSPKDAAETISLSVLPDVDLIRGSQETTLLERELQQTAAPSTALRRVLRALPAYDYAVIDCGPSLGTLVLNAICAADEILIPVEAASLALAGLGQVRETLRDLADAEVIATIPPARVLITRHDGRTALAHDVTTYLRTEGGLPVFQAVIRTSTKIAESFGARETIFSYAPRDRAAADYLAVTAEFLTPPNGETTA